MPPGRKRPQRDVDKACRTRRFVDKRRRLADALEEGKRFRVQVAGERVSIPPTVVINIEHERDGEGEEVEFQLKWSLDD